MGQHWGDCSGAVKLCAGTVNVAAEAALSTNIAFNAQKLAPGFRVSTVTRLGKKSVPQRETMSASATNALALLRFGFGRGGGSFAFILLLVIIGIIVSALLRSTRQESTKS
jgi:hypothetical protein